MSEFVVTVAGGLIVALIGFLGGVAWTRRQDARDRDRVVAWLQQHTRDEPGLSHVDAKEIAKGTALPLERVVAACFSDGRIFRYQRPTGDELWSVWSSEPEVKFIMEWI